MVRLKLLAIPVLVLLIGLALSVWVSLASYQNQKTQSFLKFDLAVNEITAAVNEEIDQYIHALYFIKGLFVADYAVSQNEFKAFIGTIDIKKQYPGLSAISFTEKENGNHFPVKYIEPEKENEEVLGFDFYSDNVRRAAMDFARDSGDARLTSTIRLLPDNAVGVLIIMPVYRIGADISTLELKRANLIGFVNAAVRIEQFSANTLKKFINRFNELKFSAFDATAKTTGNVDLLFDWSTTIEIPAQEKNSNLNSTSEIAQAGRVWKLLFEGGSDFGLAESEVIIPLILFVGGALLAMFLSVTFYMMLNARYKAVQIAELQKFKMAVDDASDLIVITDSEGIVVYVNRAMETVTGYSPKAAIGQKAAALWKLPMPEPYYKKMWKRIKTEKKPYVGEIRNRRKGGEEYDAVLSISPVLDKNGEIIFFVGIERDITKEKNIDRVKSEFVSLASHQLRTPLSSVNWYAEMLLAGDAGKINKNQKKYLKEIYNANKRMVGLVGALLNVSRLELGTFVIEPKMVDIREFASSVIKELSHDISQKKLKIVEEYGNKIPKIYIDPKLMRIVFQNLLSNAVKYTHENGKVTLKIEQKTSYVQITVADNGCGIPESARSKIFTKLFRADNAKVVDSDGTGLGLYITKSIIEQFGGKIWFESAENKGTAFYVTIPLIGKHKK
ncbi:MAG: CHASE domain-containing protein [Candidatus Gracilibacteria bacterium]